VTDFDNDKSSNMDTEEEARSVDGTRNEAEESMNNFYLWKHKTAKWK
jgi:hypothetical protein